MTIFRFSLYHSEIMLEQLPELIEPLALVDKRRQIKGSLPLSRMPRLQDLLMSMEGEARIELRFEKEGRIAAVLGFVEADLQLQCQCCLGSLSWPVHSVVSLGIVKSIDEADLLPEQYEPLLLEEDSLLLADIIQEELLLAIPPIPQHEHCEGLKPLTADGEQPAAAVRRENPFAVLSGLKKMS